MCGFNGRQDLSIVMENWPFDGALLSSPLDEKCATCAACARRVPSGNVDSTHRVVSRGRGATVRCCQTLFVNDVNARMMKHSGGRCFELAAKGIK